MANLQLSLFQTDNRLLTSRELAKKLEAFGWSYIQHWDETDIWQLKRPGFTLNFDREDMLAMLASKYPSSPI